MNKLSVIFASAALVAVLSPSRLQGAVLYQSIADITVAPDSLNWCSSCGGSYATVDQFTLLSDSAITGFNLATDAAYGAGGIGTVGVTVYDSSLSSILFQQIVGTSLVINTGNGTNIVTGSLTGLNLTAGTYRISFFGVGDDMATYGYFGGNGTLVQVTSPNSTTVEFSYPGENIAYELLGEATGVPEPSSWALVSLGVAAVGYSRKKFGKA